MPSCIALTCGCGHVWCERGGVRDIPAMLAHMRCPECRQMAALVGDVVTDPVHTLKFVPAADKPLRLKRWTVTEDRRGGGVPRTVSLTGVIVWPDDAWSEIAYEIEVSGQGEFVSAMRFDAMVGGYIGFHEIPPHLWDIAQSIALNVSTVKDWRAFIRDATAPLRGGEEADA